MSLRLSSRAICNLRSSPRLRRSSCKGNQHWWYRPWACSELLLPAGLQPCPPCAPQGDVWGWDFHGTPNEAKEFSCDSCLQEHPDPVVTTTASFFAVGIHPGGACYSFQNSVKKHHRNSNEQPICQLSQWFFSIQITTEGCRELNLNFPGFCSLPFMLVQDPPEESSLANFMCNLKV